MTKKYVVARNKTSAKVNQIKFDFIKWFFFEKFKDWNLTDKN